MVYILECLRNLTLNPEFIYSFLVVLVACLRAVDSFMIMSRVYINHRNFIKTCDNFIWLLEFLRKHGVTKREVNCPNCQKFATFTKKGLWETEV